MAIEYLMPSGLFSKLSRPIMKPPELINPSRKQPQFGLDGRPFHYLFYTSKPNFYQAMSDIYENLQQLNEFEDQMIRQGLIEAPESGKVDLSGSEWLKIDEMRALFLERFNEPLYEDLIRSLERLVDHPYSSRCKSFFMRFRKELVALAEQTQIPPLTYTEDGRPYATSDGKFEQRIK